jgi:hypothetical protein
MKGVVWRQIESAGVSNWHTAPIAGEQTIKSMHIETRACVWLMAPSSGMIENQVVGNERATKDSLGRVFCPSLCVFPSERQRTGKRL